MIPAAHVTVIELYPDIGEFAVRFDSGRIECLKGEWRDSLFVGMRGKVTFRMTNREGSWAFVPFITQHAK